MFILDNSAKQICRFSYPIFCPEIVSHSSVHVFGVVLVIVDRHIVLVFLSCCISVVCPHVFPVLVSNDMRRSLSLYVVAFLCIVCLLPRSLLLLFFILLSRIIYLLESELVVDLYPLSSVNELSAFFRFFFVLSPKTISPAPVWPTLPSWNRTSAVHYLSTWLLIRCPPKLP